MTNGLLFGLQRFSTEDGPGIRTTAFLKGCPMRCPWCQNPEGMSPRKQLLWSSARCLGDGACVEACSRGALARTDGRLEIDRARCDGCGDCATACPAGALEVAGEERDAADLVEELCRDRAFYRSSGGGVTLSGGEPLVQLPFVAEVLDRLGEAGIHRALDTCGAAGGAELDAVLERVEHVLYDLKHLDAERHQALTGVRLDTVLDNARRVAESRAVVWVRTPIIPGFTDTEGNVRAIARFIRSEMPRVERWDLLAFSRLCVSKYERLGIAENAPASLPAVARSRMERLREIAAEEGMTCVAWSGMTSDA